MGLDDMPGALGPVGGGVLFEALHADWPAYPGDRSWELALLRLGDFPLGTKFTCVEVMDQAVLFVADVGNKMGDDPYSEKLMHVAVRLEELLELDERGLVNGIELELTLSLDQLHLKRTLGSDLWEEVRSGETVIGAHVDGVFVPYLFPEDEESSDDLDDFERYSPRRSPERVAMFAGSVVTLRPTAEPELERIGRLLLKIPPALEDRILKHLSAGLYDSAIRDAGAALEMRMREYTGTTKFGWQLIEKYVEAVRASDVDYPARLKSLRQELRSIYRFIRNEFAHNLIDLAPGRGYALLSRLCWHVTDVDGLLQRRNKSL